MYDVGDQWIYTWFVRDQNNALADAGAFAVTIVLPDGTSATSPAQISVAHTDVGTYITTYTTALAQAGRYTVYAQATGANAAAMDDEFDVRPLVSTALLSLAEAKAALGMTKSINDEEVRDYIDAVTDLIEGEIGPVIPRTVTEVVSAGQAIRLTKTPVNSVTSITGYQAGAWQVVPANTLFDPVTGVVQLYNRVGFYDQYTVVYNAGRGMTPSIKQAARVLLQHLWANQRGNAPTRDADGWTAPFTMPNAVREALNWLRTPAVG